MKKQSSAWLLAAMLTLSLSGFSQTWTKEEQEFLNFFKTGWKNHSNKPTSFENWKSVVNPDEKLTWWWTDEGTPKDLEATKNWLLNFEAEGQFLQNIHTRPLRILISGDIAMNWFYGYARISNKAGKVVDLEDKRLEIFKRDGAGWKFLGGMVDPVDEKN